MRRTGVGVQALRPLRGRAAPEPGPRHRSDASNGPPEKIQKEMGSQRVDVPGATDKQGSRLVRWAAVEAVQRVPAHTRLGAVREQIGARRGRNIGVVAAARELTELVFYGLRDGQIRRPPAAAPRTPAA
jgi:hypothetical protein